MVLLDNMFMKKIFLVLIGCVVLVLIFFGFKNFSNKSAQNNLANPASENCIKNGGTLEIRKNKMGEYGVCLFEDNRQCEEWALFRDQCPVGGLKIT